MSSKNENIRPENLQADDHRPAGSPMPREAHTQDSQFHNAPEHSTHRDAAKVKADKKGR